MEFKILEYKDIPFLNDIRNECREFLHNNSYYNLEETYNWFEKTNPEFYIIYHNKNKIGYFRTSDLNDNDMYIGCDIHKEFRGLGFGYLAYKEFIPFIIEKHKLKTLYLEVLAINIRALNLYIKLGFQEIQRFDIIRDGEKVENIKMKYE